MTAEALIAVSAAVTTLVQLAKWSGLPSRFGPLAVLILSAIGTAVWAWSQADFTRATAFGYFAGWLGVAIGAAGIFGFTRSTTEEAIVEGKKAQITVPKK